MDDWRGALPYGDAFCFVDEILMSSDDEKRIVTRTDYATRGELIGAHQVAGEVVVPGVLLAEQAAQSAFLLGRRMGWLGERDRALLGRLNCTFERAVDGQAQVEAHVRAQLVARDVAGFRAEIEVDGEVVGHIVLAVKNLGPGG